VGRRPLPPQLVPRLLLHDQNQQRHIGPNTDVPAGDIGVGGREISYLFGQYKRRRPRIAGDVATSGLETSQNSARISWTREEVDDKLHKIMVAIHRNCYETADKYGTPGNLVNGANIAGFLKVADAMLDQGPV